MSPEVLPPVREGELIAGKYRVERVLGAGGMGVVVAALHLQLKQRVAVKFLLQRETAGPEAIARFLREAEAAARIQSEHVTRVIDVASLENGTPYMVMEFLEGSDLAARLQERGPFPLEEAVGYVLEACEGIADAHAAGVVHRDLKPSNIFLSKQGARIVVKVLDFGISKTTDPSGAAEAALTQSTAFLGSPLYMSPEQMASAKHVDQRTDIWSVGITLFELLTGKIPFDGASVTEFIAKVLQEPPRSVSELRPDLPSGFPAALARALEKDRTRRYRDIGEFAAAIAPFGPRHSDAVVERIALTLGSARLALDATQAASGLESAAPQVAFGVTAPAPGGGTTGKAVWADREGAPRGRSGSRGSWLLAGALAVSVSGMAWLRFAPHESGAVPSASNAAAPPPSASPAMSDAVPSASQAAPAGSAAPAGGVAQTASSAPSSAVVPSAHPRPRPHVDLLDRRD